MRRAPRQAESCGDDARRVRERARAGVGRRTQDSLTRGRTTRARLTNGRIVEEGVREFYTARGQQ
jgi:hypothetical protein